MTVTLSFLLCLTPFVAILAIYGVGISHRLAQKLIDDGISGGYIELLEQQNDWVKLAQFHDFYNRVAFSTPRQWQPAAPQGKRIMSIS